ncbi:MAG: hypothetical protein JXQ67_03875 [Campylobacterales bacterium]|nr:hypothetical protein [Campylobacterales bacterium]
MKFALRKVTKTPLDFELQSGAITFKGYLEYDSGKLILLKAHMQGYIEKPCDICAEDFQLAVDEEIEFFISDGLYDGDNDVEFDVVESFDGNADMDEILNSEIELIKSDYHTCDSCRSKED